MMLNLVCDSCKTRTCKCPWRRPLYRKKTPMLKKINNWLANTGYVLVPITSGKMLIEHANVSETHHPSRGGNTVTWMRNVAAMMPYYGDKAK